jgi:hypothetical protein
MPAAGTVTSWLQRHGHAVAWALAVVVAGATVLALERARDRTLERIAERQRDLELLAAEPAPPVAAPESPAADGGRAAASFATALEQTAAHTVGRERIVAIAPAGAAAQQEGTGAVEIRLRGAPLAQVVELLYRVRRGPVPARVPRLEMRPGAPDGDGFDVSAEIAPVEMPR